MDGTVMSVGKNTHGIVMAASVLLSRLVWYFKPDVDFAHRARKLAAEFGKPKSGAPFPQEKRDEIVKQHSPKMATAVHTILNRGEWSPSMRHMRNPPVDGRKLWELCRHWFKRVALFSYDEHRDKLCLSATGDPIVGHPWWDKSRLRQAESGKLSHGVVSTAQSRYCKFVRGISERLSVDHGRFNNTLCIGSALYEPTKHTEYDPAWVHGAGGDLERLKLEVPRAALRLPESAKYLRFVVRDIGPVFVDMRRIFPEVDWDVPAEVEAGDPWIFYGETLR